MISGLLLVTAWAARSKWKHMVTIKALLSGFLLPIWLQNHRFQ